MRRGVLMSAAAFLVAAGLGGAAEAVTASGQTSVRYAHSMPVMVDPGARTDPAGSVGQTSATLNGYVTAPNDQQDTYGFQYGTTTAYGHWAPASGPNATVAEAGPNTVSQSVTSLAPATTYHYRTVLEVTVYQGDVPGPPSYYYGGDQSFTTLPASPVPAVPAKSSGTTTTPGATTPSSTTTTSTTTTSTTSAAPTTSASGTGTIDSPASTPVVGRSADVGTVSGSVTVTLPGSSTPQHLAAGASIPLGAVVDATHGVVKVADAVAGGAIQSATVWAGRFTMTQNRLGLTTFHLVGAPSCAAGRTPHTARKAPVKLWAHDHHGRYSTRGQNSVATVRGTVWETIESCAGTRTVVRQGVVSVLNLHTHRSVLVHAGHSVLVGR